MTTVTRIVRAPRGTTLTCKGWPQEAALRMLMNNLDPDVAERPDDLVVYGGSGKAARNWPAFDTLGAARAHRQCHARARVGHVEELSRAGSPRPDDVRTDDGRVVDLHRLARDS